MPLIFLLGVFRVKDNFLFLLDYKNITFTFFSYFSLHPNERVELKRVRLKPSAIPSIFPNLPKYLSTKQPPKCSTSSSSSSRLEKENHLLQEQEKFKEQDAFQDLASLKIKIGETVLPSGYLKAFKNDSIEFHCISRTCADASSAPKLLASLIIPENLVPCAYVDSIFLPNVMYDHLLSSSAIRSLTEISNVLAFCKSMSKEFLDDHINKIMLVKVALNALQQYLDTASTLEDPNNSFGLIQFLFEQLKLVAVDKGARRYSSDLITIAFLW